MDNEETGMGCCECSWAHFDRMTWVERRAACQNVPRQKHSSPWIPPLQPEKQQRCISEGFQFFEVFVERGAWVGLRIFDALQDRLSIRLRDRLLRTLMADQQVHKILQLLQQCGIVQSKQLLGKLDFSVWKTLCNFHVVESKEMGEFWSIECAILTDWGIKYPFNFFVENYLVLANSKNLRRCFANDGKPL